MQTCPCCSDQLIRQCSQQTLYWYCRRCRQEMPVLSPPLANHQENSVSTLHYSAD
ncbi:MAG: hypothetical protein VKK04_11965 [Synechococcales bacterium]|nr:hypothetical protein [Synechococcales bacterium]